MVESVHTSCRPVAVPNDGWLPAATQLISTLSVINKIVRKHYPQVGNTRRAQHPVSLTTGASYVNVDLEHGGVERAREGDLPYTVKLAIETSGAIFTKHFTIRESPLRIRGEFSAIHKTLRILNRLLELRAGLPRS